MELYYTLSPVKSEDFVKQVLQTRYGINAPRFSRTEHGKPYLENATLYFNLSHSGKLTALAVGDAEMGLDIQFCRPEIPPTLQSRLTPAEREEDFWELWTAKEAFVKWKGASLAALLSHLKYEKRTLFLDGKPIPAYLLSERLEGCSLTLCTASPASFSKREQL